MRTVYCSICSTNIDIDNEGVQGDIGIIPVAFCPTCKAGIYDFACQTWDLIPREDFAQVALGDQEKGEDWDCGCSEEATHKCVSVVCPRK